MAEIFYRGECMCVRMLQVRMLMVVGTYFIVVNSLPLEVSTINIYLPVLLPGILNCGYGSMCPLTNDCSLVATCQNPKK